MELSVSTADGNAIVRRLMSRSIGVKYVNRPLSINRGRRSGGRSAEAAGHGEWGQRADKLRIVRDIAYEFAEEKDRDFAVDVFIHVTGIAEFGPTSRRDYGRKHGCTHEWFRRKAEEMRKRLDLPLLPSEREEAIRAEHRLVNRKNDAA